LTELGVFSTFVGAAETTPRTAMIAMAVTKILCVKCISKDSKKLE
jgi:hypothetical protein